MDKNIDNEIYSFVNELDTLNSDIKQKMQINAASSSDCDKIMLEKLTVKLNKIKTTVSEYEKLIENYANLLEVNSVQKKEIIEKLNSSSSVMSNLEQYTDKLEASAIQKNEFSKEMEDYANKLEVGLVERSKELSEIGEAVSGLSHCIKNIVTNLKGGAFVIEQGLHQNKNELIEDGWTLIRNNIARISDLALDMLVYSKGGQPDYTDYDINVLIKDILKFSEDNAFQHGVKLSSRLKLAHAMISIDQKGIYRSLLNLVSNGIDACAGKTGGEVIVKTGLAKEQGMIEIAISDNGPGMSQDIKNKIFTTFFSTKGSKGTGLGLTTTYKIINSHKGTIHVESEVNVGTTFVIKLPANI